MPEKINSQDERFMRRAIELAVSGLGSVHPNPLVGAVVVSNGKIIAEGAHLKFGGPHAEVLTLAKKIPAGSTLYVTLEPCAHTGKTPPCVDVILKAKPARVVIAARDVNPLVSGKGIRALQKAGIKVSTGVLEKEALDLNRDFNHWILKKTPYVIAKAAQTIDGRIAAAGGESKWITGSEARKAAHRLRAESDAVLVGIGTALADDPRLDVRLKGVKANPYKVVLDGELRLSPKARLFSKGARVIVFTSEKASPKKIAAFSSKADVVRVSRDAKGLSWKVILKELGRRGVTRLLIEGGGQTIGSAFRAKIVNEVYFFIAPKILGGGGSVSSVSDAGIRRLEDVVTLKQMSISRVGDDWLLKGRI